MSFKTCKYVDLFRTKELKQNYNNLLLQTSRVYSECFPIKLGEST